MLQGETNTGQKFACIIFANNFISYDVQTKRNENERENYLCFYVYILPFYAYVYKTKPHQCLFVEYILTNKYRNIYALCSFLRDP